MDATATNRASESARRRWQGTDPETRRANTAKATAMSVERRKVAAALLTALTAAGLRVELDEGFGP